MVDEHDGKIFIKGIGSEAMVISSDIPACNGVIHTVDTVLLPLDGDGKLEGADSQITGKERMI